MDNLPFQSPEWLAIWEELLQYRRQRKLPAYVPTGLKRTYNRIYRLSGGDEQTAIKIIEQTIENNYQGFFPLKDQNSGTASSTGASAKRGTSADRIRKASEW